MPMYLKQYMGVTSGTMGGRDDGYPEVKHRVYHSIEELADAPTVEDEEIFVCEPVNGSDIAKQIAAARRREEKKKKDKDLQDKEELFNKLKKELGK